MRWILRKQKQIDIFGKIGLFGALTKGTNCRVWLVGEPDQSPSQAFPMFGWSQHDVLRKRGRLLHQKQTVFSVQGDPS